MVLAPLRQYPGWTVALGNVKDVVRQGCGLEDNVTVLRPTPVPLGAPVNPATTTGNFVDDTVAPVPEPVPGSRTGLARRHRRLERPRHRRHRLVPGAGRLGRHRRRRPDARGRSPRRARVGRVRRRPGGEPPGPGPDGDRLPPERRRADLAAAPGVARRRARRPDVRAGRRRLDGAARVGPPRRRRALPRAPVADRAGAGRPPRARRPDVRGDVAVREPGGGARRHRPAVGGADPRRRGPDLGVLRAAGQPVPRRRLAVRHRRRHLRPPRDGRPARRGGRQAVGPRRPRRPRPAHRPLRRHHDGAHEVRLGARADPRPRGVRRRRAPGVGRRA